MHGALAAKAFGVFILRAFGWVERIPCGVFVELHRAFPVLDCINGRWEPTQVVRFWGIVLSPLPVKIVREGKIIEDNLFTGFISDGGFLSQKRLGLRLRAAAFVAFGDAFAFRFAVSGAVALAALIEEGAAFGAVLVACPPPACPACRQTGSADRGRRAEGAHGQGGDEAGGEAAACGALMEGRSAVQGLNAGALQKGLNGGVIAEGSGIQTLNSTRLPGTQACISLSIVRQ